jgi:Arc/MetJ-type ribon-helix-helix transcriptional regulator
MTAYTKFAVSMPTRVAEGARRAVRKGRAASLSAYVAKAVEAKLAEDDLASLIDEMLAETGGPMTAAERRETERALGITRPARRKRRR